ncbi:MAG: outer membrane protein assembly factor BamB [Formivibrio sp.]|nr:outer membrane protein assembly factor BamB [Formivibrio sp.]
MNLCRSLIAVSIVALVAGCGVTSNAPKPAPLPVVQNKASVLIGWHQSLGSASGSRLQPAVRGDAVAALSGEKNLVFLDAKSGSERWQVSLPSPAAGGVGLGDDLVVVGTLKGEILAFGWDGKPRWNAHASSEVLAPPVVAGSLVLVRGGDGRLTAYSAADGAVKWIYTRQQPALQLRSFAPPVVAGDVVYYGQAGGRLAAITLNDGHVLWESQVALPHGVSEIERIADVVAAPVVQGDLVCAVAYQGRLACFNVKNGGLIWSREVSSWSGMAMDSKAVYVTDDKGQVMAYERSSGRNLWRQDKLAARVVSGPTVMGRTLVVGDYQGYAHFIDTDDGSFVAQQPTDGGAIVVAPQLAGERWLIQTQKGGLYLMGLK